MQTATILLATVCLCVISLTLQESGDDCTHPLAHEVVQIKDDAFIRSIAECTMYECAAECKLLALCLSFTSDKEQRTCQLREKTSPSFTVGSGVFISNIQQWKMPITGACSQSFCGPHSRCIVGRYGQPMCESSDVIGMNCKHDADCHVGMTSCFFGHCLCDPGYSHNIRHNSCDRECKSYGDNMTWYKGLGIGGHNTKNVNIAGGMRDAMKMCMAACVQETDFVCKTVDFGDLFEKYCSLSNVGYLDVSKKDRETGQLFWWLDVRRCQ